MIWNSSSWHSSRFYKAVTLSMATFFVCRRLWPSLATETSFLQAYSSGCWMERRMPDTRSSEWNDGNYREVKTYTFRFLSEKCVDEAKEGVLTCQYVLDHSTSNCHCIFSIVIMWLWCLEMHKGLWNLRGICIGFFKMVCSLRTNIKGSICTSVFVKSSNTPPYSCGMILFLSL